MIPIFSTSVSIKGYKNMRLPLGYENFKELIDHRFNFVDKSLLIKEILDDDITKVVLITRPRRFGKTLNLSMLHHFLASEVNGQSTTGLFTGLKITAAGEEYIRHQGKYPVIFITFKEIEDHTFEHILENMQLLMARVYEEHHYLLSSPKLSETNKIFYETVLKGQANEALLKVAILNLTGYLYQHHGVKPWVLIDEYDKPIQSAYLHDYYNKMIRLMRGMLGAALKTNPYLERAVITGILRISKESLFSDLNNLKVYSLLQSRYGQYFGFTEEEVTNLLQQAGLEQKAAEIRAWYNGYQSGEYTIYNPWSIVNCINEKGRVEPYWINTSGNELIKELLTHAGESFRLQFEDLLSGKSVEKLIDENMVFSDLKKNNSATWSLLLLSGYLKVTGIRDTEMGPYCTLIIPNREIRGLYRRIIEQWLSNGHGTDWFENFLNHFQIQSERECS
jgi:hypothetical protein